MRRPALLLVALSCVVAAATALAQPGDAIVAVLDRSQQKRLDSLPAANPDTARARLLRADFDTLTRALDLHRDIELRVISGDVVGETLQGRVVVVNQSMAGLPQGERLFILAHEIGHVALDHWTAMGGLYRKWIPDEVVPATTDPIAANLGRDASALAHDQEFEADAFALRTMRALGRSDDEVLATFVHLGMHNDTATHPGTRRRMAALQALMHADSSVARSGSDISSR